MEIAAFTSLAQTAKTTQASRHATPAGVAATEKKNAEIVNLEKTDKAILIMKKYDLHDISNQEVFEMTHELHEAGVITGFQHMRMNSMLLPIPFKLVDGQAAIEENPKNLINVKKDYLENVELYLAAAERDGNENTVTDLKSIVNLLHNLDALHVRA